jgi:hypothetical protein
VVVVLLLAEGDGMNRIRVPTAAMAAVMVVEVIVEVATVEEVAMGVDMEGEGASEVAAGIWTPCSWPSLISATFQSLRRIST